MTTWTPATEQTEPWFFESPDSSRAFDRLAFSNDAFDVDQYWEPWVASIAETETWTAPSEQTETWTAVTKQPEGWT